MNFKEFASRFAEKCGIAKYKAEDYCQVFLELMSEGFDELDPGERILFSGFGTFTKKRRPGHAVGDFKTGGRMEIPDKDRIVFTRSKVADRDS